MAGLSKLEVTSCIRHCSEALKSQELKLHGDFVELVSVFLKGSSNSDCFRPLPPRLGNGDCVDLLQLYLIVKQKGGFEVISEKNLWDEVGLLCGLSLSFGSAFKLIYAKYLSSIESWLVNLDKEKNLESKVLMELESDYNVSEIVDVKRGSDGSCSFQLGKSGISFSNLTNEDYKNESKKLGLKKLVMDFADYDGSNEGSGESVYSKQQNIVMDYANDGLLEENHVSENVKRGKRETSFIDGISSDGSDNRRSSASPVVVDDVVKSSEILVASKKCSTKDDGGKMMNVDSGVSEVSSHKRKRDCFLGMLRWMADVAKDPTDPMSGEIPESSRWASYANDNTWKQALLAREALFLKKIQVHSVDQFGWQKKQKMHPLLFDHSINLCMTTLYQTESNPPRPRPRQRFEARLDMQPTASIYTGRPQQRIPVGKAFQAELPDWTGVPIESDSKWLGSRTWPLAKAENGFLFKRVPRETGRIHNCGCQFPGSIECVKVHVAERRMKMRFKLGSAFYAWNFSNMGEDCSVSWTIEEEKIFRNVVLENPQTSEKGFWEPMCKALPQKRWADQVNYYYNVFMLRRRGYQNRHFPTDIDSDDDETEYHSIVTEEKTASF